MLILNCRLNHRMNDLVHQNQHQNQPRTLTLIKATLLAASLGLCLGSPSASAETFYKWVDKDGSTHYTQTPPTKKGAKATKKVFIDDMAPLRQRRMPPTRTIPMANLPPTRPATWTPISWLLPQPMVLFLHRSPR